jgi:hypothetical protein
MRGKTDYLPRVCRQRNLLFAGIGSAMLVTGVQSFVGAFYEDFAPLDEAGGGKPGDGAKDDFLEKRGLHLSR